MSRRKSKHRHPTIAKAVPFPFQHNNNQEEPFVMYVPFHIILLYIRLNNRAFQFISIHPNKKNLKLSVGQFVNEQRSRNDDDDGEPTTSKKLQTS